mgnify:CR=1 FL=1
MDFIWENDAVTLNPLRTATLVLLALGLGSATPVWAQQAQGTFQRLQEQPMTLFDAGMKSLRRLALDTAEKIALKTGHETTVTVNYRHPTASIEIVFQIKTKPSGTATPLQQQCIELRREAILKMFRIGLSDYASNLSTSERIRRRIGGQFAPEPVLSMNESIALGEQLGQITFFEVKLTSEKEPGNAVSCRALATDSMAK